MTVKFSLKGSQASFLINSEKLQTMLSKCFYITFVMTLFLLLGCTQPTNNSLTVFAASSLTEAFTELKLDFENLHPQSKVLLQLAGSQILRSQIEHGAEVDVFASANLSHIHSLKLESKSSIFALNQLALIVPPENPSDIQSILELEKAQRLIIGTPQTPIGEYTKSLFDKLEKDLGSSYVTSISSKIVSMEHNVRLIRSKVELGEADAGIVYTTEALSAAAQMIEIPKAYQIDVAYHITTVEPLPDKLSLKWLSLVSSKDGQDVLLKHGFRFK